MYTDALHVRTVMFCKTAALVTFVQMFMRIVHFMVELFCLFSVLPIMAKQS